MINLDEILTFSEAAEKWGLADGKSIRKAVERNKFKDYEIKKSGNVWLTTYDAMYRVYGEPKEANILLPFYDLFDFRHRNLEHAMESFLKQGDEALENGKMISVVESLEHPERIVCILKNKEEFANWKRRLKYYFQTSNVNQDKEE